MRDAFGGPRRRVQWRSFAGRFAVSVRLADRIRARPAGAATARPATAREIDAAEVRRRSIAGLNGLNFFVADMFTGFGPFVTVYLTSHGWLPTDIGIALSVGTLAGVAGQVPAGTLVDAVFHRRLLTAIGIAAVIASALVLAALPLWWPVLGAELLQGIAAALLTPAVAAMTLSLSRSGKLGQRLGGNVRYKALGSMLTALLMGYIGTHISTGAVFYVSAVFGGIALGFLPMISGVDIRNAAHRTQHPGALPKHLHKAPPRRKIEVWRDPLLLTFAACIFMFHFSNAAVLPFAISAVQSTGMKDTDMLVSVALVVSQVIVAIIAPRVGVLAEARGRKTILLAGFVALAVRCALLAVWHGEVSLVLCQVLDGISSTAIGVMVPLIVADITLHGGRFNLALGIVGLAVSAGATLSTTIAGYVTEHFGSGVAFFCLACAAGVGCLLVMLALPETGRGGRKGAETAATT
jgi:MFS family permease